MEKIIEIKNLSYTYPDGTCALKDVNLEIFRSESVGIVGPNGSGKTTMLLHLNGILCTDGCVKICGLSVNEKNLGKIRQKTGLLFQDPDDQLFMPTVFEDVAFGPINMELDSIEVDRRVDNALKFVDMKDYRDRVSHHLSFGEKKRISLATVISMNPEILILDEPTGNLDPRHRKEFIEFLKGLDITRIIATHDIDMVSSICDRVALMDRGRIVAFDTVEHIFNNRDLVRTYGLD